ncbi:hypothetical protein BRADI_4g28322v3 [Brachypodium distachyon]|uniref:Uncharacterized protein n=1 Tax=Brachypodium distachyon TaxID=15368 RepID=A0A2K2CQV9_BRADI|nr:hypothetical protein BRADI_4g28322v3 [Brachypodium distachyon]
MSRRVPRLPGSRYERARVNQRQSTCSPAACLPACLPEEARNTMILQEIV